MDKQTTQDKLVSDMERLADPEHRDDAPVLAGPPVRIDPPPSASTAVMRRTATTTLIRPIAPVAELMAAQDEVSTVIASLLKDGTDYGTIPGTKKPTLYKAGAERTCRAFGIIPEFVIVERDADATRVTTAYTKRWNNAFQGDRSFTLVPVEVHGFYRYVIRCDLVHAPTGEIVGTGLGACASVESKYQDRPNDVENTVVKMAKKRALVDATLTAFALSDRFTQDLEDMAVEREETTQPRAAARPAKAKAAAATADAPPRVADSARTEAPADTLPPANHPLAGRQLGDWTDPQIDHQLAMFAKSAELRDHYPVFLEAVTAEGVARGILTEPES